MPDVHVVIPARYASTRLRPAKALADIHGMTMLEHVYRRAIKADVKSVTVATDHLAIIEAAENMGAHALMTSTRHESGTERVAEAIDLLGLPDDAIVVNLQGDEPLINPYRITILANDLLHHDSIQVSTLAEQLSTAKDYLDPNVVKVVLNKDNFALYFSRSPIPAIKGVGVNQLDDQHIPKQSFKHIGLYAYRAAFLRQLINLPVADISLSESLEQLNILWNGEPIHVVEVKDQRPSISVDTLEDLEHVRRLIESRPELLDGL